MSSASRRGTSLIDFLGQKKMLDVNELLEKKGVARKRFSGPEAGFLVW